MSVKPTPAAGRLIVLGGGNMGGAIVRGAIDSGVLKAELVAIAEPDEHKRRELMTAGITTFKDTPGALKSATANCHVLIAVKPQMFPLIASSVAEAAEAGAGILSIMAGVPTWMIGGTIRKFVRTATPSVVRIMPNLAVMVGKGAIAISPARDARAESVLLAQQLFGSLGEVTFIDESMMDAFTVLSGSGPAYLFYLAEAMEKAALAGGFGADEARRIVRQTLIGSARLMEADRRDPRELRAGVTSKGGTTAAAISVLDSARVMDTFVKALAAGRDRGAELARLAALETPAT